MAIVLLAWTAIDLAYPTCCLRDAASSPSDAAVNQATSSPSTPDETQADDCFCCALCVDTGVRIPVAEQPAIATPSVESVTDLATRPARIDHPPQNA